MPPIKAANPELGWKLASEQHVRLSDYQGKVVVLDFYATWCEPCRESIPHLVDLQQRYGLLGLQVVGLNVGGPDDRDKITDFAREFRIQYPLGLPDKSLTDLYLSDSDAIPQTFVFDRQGQVVKRFIGYGDSMATELEHAVETSLASKAE